MDKLTLEETLVRGSLMAAASMLGALLREVAALSSDPNGLTDRVWRTTEKRTRDMAQTLAAEFEDGDDPGRELPAEINSAATGFVNSAFAAFHDGDDN